LTDPGVISALNQQAVILENNLFASNMVAGLSLDGTAGITSVRLFFARFREAAGGPNDPIEKLLLDQILAAHIKIAELYAAGAGATNIDFVRGYQNAAARMLSGICQLVSTLTAYRASVRAHRRRGKAGRAAESGGAEPPASEVQSAARGEKPDSKLASNATRGRR
jgi:hypothetical protein